MVQYNIPYRHLSERLAYSSKVQTPSSKRLSTTAVATPGSEPRHSVEKRFDPLLEFQRHSISDDNSEAMLEAERIIKRSLPRNRDSVADDDSYTRLRTEGTGNGSRSRSRPVSDTNVFLPLRSACFSMYCTLWILLRSITVLPFLTMLTMINKIPLWQFHLLVWLATVPVFLLFHCVPRGTKRTLMLLICHCACRVSTEWARASFCMV